MRPVHSPKVATNGNGRAQSDSYSEWRSANGNGKSTASLAAPRSAQALRLLLVDPNATPETSPRPVIEVVAATARRHGAWPIICSASDPESFDINLAVTEPAAVLVILEYVPPRREGEPDAYGSCERAAHLTKTAREARLPVIAINVGASAAALAACVEQGAVGLFDLELLGYELTRISREEGTSRTNGHDDARITAHLPAPFDSLVRLTPSERRVLFHMMEGRSASEIAAKLVVSVTTVRSHIRSILRKLSVKSQLAAVAVAFGTLLDQAASG
jgi:DNA-binding CsgD family transcriptional regulator